MTNIDQALASANHPNRRAHNWLAFQAKDELLLRNSKLYVGDLYDLGAGESPYRDFFLQYANRYFAVDWPGSIHDTKTDITADLNETLPIEDNTADTIVCLSVLEHLREPQFFLEEAWRILKPDSAILLQVPWQWWIHEAPHDFFRYTPYGLTYLFEQAGFEDIQVKPLSGFFSMMVLKVNYFSLRLIRGPRSVKCVLRGIFGIFWYLGQHLAPILDKLDKRWELEAHGYFETAKKS